MTTPLRKPSVGDVALPELESLGCGEAPGRRHGYLPRANPYPTGSAFCLDVNPAALGVGGTTAGITDVTVTPIIDMHRCRSADSPVHRTSDIPSRSIAWRVDGTKDKPIAVRHETVGGRRANSPSEGINGAPLAEIQVGLDRDNIGRRTTGGIDGPNRKLRAFGDWHTDRRTIYPDVMRAVAVQAGRATDSTATAELWGDVGATSNEQVPQVAVRSGKASAYADEELSLFSLADPRGPLL